MRQVNSQTSSPKASALDTKNFHYLRCQNADKGDWQTPIEDYLNGNDDAGIPQYELVSQDRKLTGSSRMSLLRMPRAEHEAHLKAIAEASKAGVQATQNAADGTAFEEISGGQPL